MKLLWEGTLAFGLVNVPIRLYEAVRKREIEFRLLHEPDRAPIRYRKVCGEEKVPVPDSEIVRGYPLDHDWVVLTSQEIEAAAPTLTRSITIQTFVDLHEIDPIFFRKPYYLAPAEGGEELYATVREAIRRSRKVGIARFVLLHREHLAVVRTLQDTLVAETLHYPEDLIDPRQAEPPAEVRLREGEIRLAVELIQHLSGSFDPAEYRNEFRQHVLELIRRKAEGRLPPALVPPPPPTPTPVVDLTRRLRESLERAERERRRRAA